MERAGSSRAAVFALAAALGIALLAGVLYLATRGDVASPGPGSTSTQDEPPTSSTPSTTGQPVPDEFEVAIDEIIDFIEAARNEQFSSEPQVHFVGDDEFIQRLLRDFEEDRDEIDRTGRLLVALGLVEEGVDFAESLRKLLGVGVVGFYDPEAAELVVRGTELTPFVRVVLVHELTHALDDQLYDLDRQDLDDADDESAFGFSVLVEGSAMRVEEQYRQTLSSQEQFEATEEELSTGGDTDVSDIPPILTEVLSFPYLAGPGLVSAIVDDGGEAAIEAAFAEPPTTSEQLLHPDAYLDGEGAVAVEAPPADGEVVDEGAFGELVLVELLDSEVERVDAEQAAEGWGGDWYVAWEEGDSFCVRVDFVMDTAEDRAELLAALEEWSANQEAADIAEAGDSLRLTACS
ncbi:MAG: hypothetical protein JJLCMIEE_02894 [Acidimicrobiales bacterium]|nr:hypothetical protein [Acidimicrobiales bacterium]